MEDEHLVEQARSGNAQAFRLLVLRYQGPLFKFLKGFGMPASRVEELAQETFFKAHRSLHSYRPEKGARFVTWLFVIAKRLAQNEMERAEHRATAVEVDQAIELECLDLTPAARVEAEERRRLVREALQQVPTPFREALVMSYLDELKLAEIARVEQCSLGTVKSRIFRGKQLLAAILSRQLQAAP